MKTKLSDKLSVLTIVCLIITLILKIVLRTIALIGIYIGSDVSLYDYIIKDKSKD